MTRLARYRFDGRTGVLTGAASGIGEQLAYLLATRGSDLVLVDIDERRLTAVTRRIHANHPSATSKRSSPTSPTAPRSTASPSRSSPSTRPWDC
ncbi:SDR family NAD(P)-dependent oxidoreductase [Micromonospora sp. NBC_00858]|uniref:SDR family NAD(P)-dependent oxidoreductase n=1 Tax=Micromonospora sp. NBC_00858 TaxID=2975979 RepID=UPI0038704404|nr:SDR family NAD(P)-dependent oxidoreductase [Micromonospora sp. NBC_00858]